MGQQPPTTETVEGDVEGTETEEDSRGTGDCDEGGGGPGQTRRPSKAQVRSTKFPVSKGPKKPQGSYVSSHSKSTSLSTGRTLSEYKGGPGLPPCRIYVHRGLETTLRKK